MGFQIDNMTEADDSDDEDLEAELSALTEGLPKNHQKKSKSIQIRNKVRCT